MKGLLNRKQWVCWRLEHVEGRPKPTKVPYSPIHGYKASTTNPADWSDYHTALGMAQMYGMSGVGFVFTENDPYFFIDVDNCLVDQATATWSPLAHEFVNRFPGAYTEVSQSGTGLHIICAYTSLPEGFNSLNDQKTGLEMYWRDRFVAMTLTGNGEVDVDYTQGVHDSIARYGRIRSDRSAHWTSAPCDEWSGSEDDEELIAMALKSSSAASVFGNKASFADLWTANVEKLSVSYASDQGKDYNASAADAALCSHLAFWTGKNCERMERLFNKSALVRSKWTDRQDYRETTILGAVERCDTVYRAQPALTQELINAVTPAPTVAVTGSVPAYMTIRPGEGAYGANHTVNASTFVNNYYPNNTLIFVQQQPYRFNGRVWERVTEDELKHQLSMAMLASEPKADVINGTYKVLSYLFTRADRELGTWPGVDVSHYIVCQNGILDVHTRKCEPHNPDFFTTSILPYSYDPFAQAPVFQEFLNTTLEGDQERIALLQEWLGYMLVNSYDYQKAMLMIGAPRSGKGTIGQIIQALVGEEAYAGITLEGLANDAILETVLDKSVLFIGDAHSVSGPDRNRILDRFKSITGADAIPVNRKYKGAWNGRLPGRMTLAANNIPAFADDSGAMANRLLILPFNVSFLNREDITLKSRLMKELPGICNWAIEGLERLRKNNRFTEPAASIAERQEIMDQQAPLMAFVRDCCELLPDSATHTEELFCRYKMWKMQEGGATMTKTAFSRAFKSMLRGRVVKDVVSVNGQRANGFRGVRLLPFQSAANVLPFPPASNS